MESTSVRPTLGSRADFVGNTGPVQRPGRSRDSHLDARAPRLRRLLSDARSADPVTTIRDVAQLAGVSTMTVSRVINRSGYASEAARRRVDRAVAELGYVPNAVARQLRSKRTRTIALVVSDITNPFFTVIARGVEDAARQRDHAVIFVNTDESQTLENVYLRILMGRQVDGVLLVPAGNSAEPFRLLRSQKIPVVVLDRRVQAVSYTHLRAHETDSYLVCRLLLEKK